MAKGARLKTFDDSSSEDDDDADDSPSYEELVNLVQDQDKIVKKLSERVDKLRKELLSKSNEKQEIDPSMKKALNDLLEAYTTLKSTHDELKSSHATLKEDYHIFDGTCKKLKGSHAKLSEEYKCLFVS